jgi:hypothetical protein
MAYGLTIAIFKAEFNAKIRTEPPPDHFPLLPFEFNDFTYLSKPRNGLSISLEPCLLPLISVDIKIDGTVYKKYDLKYQY